VDAYKCYNLFFGDFKHVGRENSNVPFEVYCIVFITLLVIEDDEIDIRYMTEIFSTSLLLLHTIALFHS
jgi:hypothetical protein